MKKLLAAGCTILAFQNFSKVSTGNEAIEQLSGRKILVKAIAVIVNTENNRKVPPNRIQVPNLESPVFEN